MADFCEDLENYIRTHPIVSQHVGYGSAAEVFPDVPRQATLTKFIVLYEAGGESEEVLTGGAGLCQSTWHIVAYGTTRKEANTLAEVIRKALRPYKGNMGGTFVNEISCATHRNTGVDQPQDGTPKARYWADRIYDIWHSETN